MDFLNVFKNTPLLFLLTVLVIAVYLMLVNAFGYQSKQTYTSVLVPDTYHVYDNDEHKYVPSKHAQARDQGRARAQARDQADARGQADTQVRAQVRAQDQGQVDTRTQGCALSQTNNATDSHYHNAVKNPLRLGTDSSNSTCDLMMHGVSRDVDNHPYGPDGSLEQGDISEVDWSMKSDSSYIKLRGHGYATVNEPNLLPNGHYGKPTTKSGLQCPTGYDDEPELATFGN